MSESRARLSWQQQTALEAIHREASRGGLGLTRRDFYGRGIRMPTVYSLHRLGVVTCFHDLNEHGRTITRWIPAKEEAVE